MTASEQSIILNHMVEQRLQLDDVFHSLADGTRRDILRRTIVRDQTISELAERYQMSFAAVAKHLTVLEKAQLITKRKEGRTQIISANKQTIDFAHEHLEKYEALWAERFNGIENLIQGEQKYGERNI